MQNLNVVKELTLFTYFPAFVCRFATLHSPSANIFCEKVHKAVEEKAMALLQGGRDKCRGICPTSLRPREGLHRLLHHILILWLCTALVNKNFRAISNKL
jgi:hypothetical protein